MASQNGTYLSGTPNLDILSLKRKSRPILTGSERPLVWVPYRYRRSLSTSGGALRLKVLTCEPSEANLLPVIVTTNIGNSNFYYR